MPCALCKQEKPLQDSHILPEFIYRVLYDEKHRLATSSFSGKPIVTFSQKGIREKLLCRECEGKFSKHEKYFKDFLSGKIQVVTARRGDFIKLTGLDYKRFKLFGLSVLWRASITKQKMFAAVKLGTKHEEELRRLLDDEDPGPPNKYGFFLIALEKEKDEPDEMSSLIMKPTPYRLRGHNCYRFVFGEYFWFFYVSQHNIPTNIQQYFINEKGEMIIGIKKMDEVTFIRDALMDMAKKFVKGGWNEKTGRLGDER